MTRSELVGHGLLPGAIAGLVGGVVLAAAMAELDKLPMTAEIARTDSAAVGFVALVVFGLLIGAGFGVIVLYQKPGAGETLFWGMVYGTFWWYLGPLTALPLLRGDGLTWDVGSAQKEFPALLGLTLCGGVAALTLVVLRWRHNVQADVGLHSPGTLSRGALAGLISAGLLGMAADAQDQLPAFTGGLADESGVGAWLVALVIGILAGVGFSLLFPRPTDGAGPGLIRGMVYGLLWWVVGGLTAIPLVGGLGLTSSIAEVRDLFVTFPGYVLFGAGVALFYQWLGGLVRLLFSDYVGATGDEGVGAQGLRLAGRSVIGGLVGGLVFSGVMLQTGVLPAVADLVGETSAVTGFVVHLAIASLIGTSYGVLFRRQSYDLGSALGWGVSYGFFWSIVGPLTLMPMFLGGTPQWTANAAAATFPNLTGHLGYGAGLAITFYLLEARYRPWWVPRTKAQAERVERRKEQVLSSAPALWTLLVALGLTLPIVLGG